MYCHISCIIAASLLVLTCCTVVTSSVHTGIFDKYLYKDDNVDNSDDTSICHKYHHRKMLHELFTPEHDTSIRHVRHYFAKQMTDSWVSGDMIIIGNPLLSLSVETEHNDSCSDGVLSPIEKTAQIHNCEVAMNGGLFNEHTGSCLGNVVHNGHVFQNSDGIKNAHFGITTEGKVFFGYLNSDILQRHTFRQLVGGAIWLVKHSVSFVERSVQEECSETQTTGSLLRFAKVKSARSAVGFTSNGRVVFVHIDGKTDYGGINLYNLADLLISYGFVSAINLDGGGSSALVINGTRTNTPTDKCKHDNSWTCSRPISTILCAKRTSTVPSTCTPTSPPTTDSRQVSSPQVCSFCSSNSVCIHGQCYCSHNNIGLNCSHSCGCLNNGFRSHLGVCRCPAGYIGQFCERTCPNNTYGDKCKYKCACQSNQECDHVNGTCSTLSVTCVPMKSDGSRPTLKFLAGFFKINYWSSTQTENATFIILFMMLFISLLINIYCLWLSLKRRCCTRRQESLASREEFVKLVTANSDSE